MGPVREELRFSAVRDALAQAVERRHGIGLAAGEQPPLAVLDLGGGTGPEAVPIAHLGHDVTVVDSSPDALALLARRAVEAGVELTAVAGDATDLPGAGVGGTFDVVLCHGLLEYVDEPGALLGSAAAVMDAGSVMSIVVPGRAAAVQALAASGDIDGAHRVLTASVDRWDVAALGPRSFWPADVERLLHAVQMTAFRLIALRTFTDLVPSSAVDGVPGARERLFALERAAAAIPEFSALCAGLQTFACLE